MAVESSDAAVSENNENNKRMVWECVKSGGGVECVVEGGGSGLWTYVMCGTPMSKDLVEAIASSA